MMTNHKQGTYIYHTIKNLIKEIKENKFRVEAKNIKIINKYNLMFMLLINVLIYNLIICLF